MAREVTAEELARMKAELVALITQSVEGEEDLVLMDEEMQAMRPMPTRCFERPTWRPQ